MSSLSSTKRAATLRQLLRLLVSLLKRFPGDELILLRCELTFFNEKRYLFLAVEAHLIILLYCLKKLTHIIPPLSR